MATLTETAYIARRSIKYGSIGLVSLTILWFVGVGLVNWWKATHPEPPPPPTVDFGPLPAIEFPTSNAVSVTQFQLQTPDGKLGKFPDRLFVFYAPTKQSSFLDPNRAIDLARKLNFLFEPVQLSETVYRWTRADPLPTSLEVNIVTGRYALKKQWQADPSLIVNKKFVSDKQVTLDGQAFLRLIGQQQEDIAETAKITYWRVSGDQLIPTISLSEADFVRVGFMRKPFEILGARREVLESYEFHTIDPKRGLIDILVSGSNDQQKKVIEVEYNYIPVDYDIRGEYPIKTVELAFEELKAGKGFVAGFGGVGTGIVRRVSLGYLDTLGEQKYAMPIYVFSGDQDLVAYVSAVDESQIER